MAHELEGTTVLGRYAVGKCLSEKGGYALTYEAVDTDKPSHPPCVVKHLRDDKHDSLSRELFEREGKALEHLTGKGPFPKLEATRGDFHVMEFLPGATLNTEDTHSEQEARKLLIELLEILVILDQVGLIHRDIKPLNLIRHKVSGKLYLIDFGMVRDKNKALDKLKDGTIAPGSQGFSAPEQFNGEASVKSDLYAVGRVVLNFWFGMPAERNWHSPLGADQRLVQVLKVMTAFLPESRTITATQALQQLRQPTLPVTPPPVTTSRSEAPTRQATSPSPRPEPVIERPTTRPSVPQETKVEEKPKPKASQGPTPGVPGWVWGLGATALAVGAGVFPPGWAFVKSLMPTPPVANRKLPSSYPAPKTLAEYKAQMMAIPGGSFARGSEKYSNEKNGGTVTLSAFKMGRTPVTVAMFQEFCTKMGRKMPDAPGDKIWKGSWSGVQDHPMVNVSWEKAKAYADWAKLKLPTEAQWEYAASGGDGCIYPWGNGWDASKCQYDAGGTAAVGSYPSGVSPFGMQDMVGNVWEWCSDWYGGYGDRTNPTGPSSGQYKVLRGGSWNDVIAEYLRCANRGRGDPSYASSSWGFRLLHPGP